MATDEIPDGWEALVEYLKVISTRKGLPLKSIETIDILRMEYIEGRIPYAIHQQTTQLAEKRKIHTISLPIYKVDSKRSKRS